MSTVLGCCLRCCPSTWWKSSRVAEEEEEEEEEEEKPAPSKRSLKRKKASGPTFQDASEFADILEAAADQDEGVHRKQAEWEGGKRKSKKRMKR